MPPPTPEASIKRERKSAEPSAGLPDHGGAPKLTKAQQKALKFKSKTKGARHVPDGGDVPEQDNDSGRGDNDARRPSGAGTSGSSTAARLDPGSIFGIDVAPLDAADEKTALFGRDTKRKRDKAKLSDNDAAAAAAAAAESPASAASNKGTKRKRDSVVIREEASPAIGEGASADGVAPTKTVWDDAGDVKQEQSVTAEEAPKKKKRRKSKAASQGDTDAAGRPRLIIFVGNMSYKVTSKQLAAHFGDTCGETPTVRLLTRKVDPAEPPKLSASKLKSIAKGKASGPKGASTSDGDDADPDPVLMGKDGKPLSKGCAFLEFTTAQAIQKALRFHHTQFGGRQINVELTAGGGGKSSGRTEKIKAKNSELESERKKLHDKYIAPAAASKKATAAERGSAQGKTATTEGAAQWGPRSGKGVSSGPSSAPGKGAKWAPSGANAMRLTS